MSKHIAFNRPHTTGRELGYIEQAINSHRISGNGSFTGRCQQFLENKYGFDKVLLTTSCTDALEMAALLLQIAPGDEVIIPSFTFVSTANAFVLRGASIKFADSRADHPGMDEDSIESLITSRTKAIVVVHYAGVACDMDRIMAIANTHGIMVVEDAAQAIDSYHDMRPLGGIGHLGTYSFHETKNIQCGEGGALLVNDPSLMRRAEIIWEKGTNRAAFWRGEVDKYNWVDVGSSFLPSEINAAFLYAQFESLDAIQERRRTIWRMYHDGLEDLFIAGRLLPPVIPMKATCNGHLFHVLLPSAIERDRCIAHLKAANVNAVFHYQSLHSSPYYKEKHDGRNLPMADRYSDVLLRLPLFRDIADEEVHYVIRAVKSYFQ